MSCAAVLRGKPVDTRVVLHPLTPQERFPAHRKLGNRYEARLAAGAYSNDQGTLTVFRIPISVPRGTLNFQIGLCSKKAGPSQLITFCPPPLDWMHSLARCPSLPRRYLLSPLSPLSHPHLCHRLGLCQWDPAD